MVFGSFVDVRWEPLLGIGHGSKKTDGRKTWTLFAFLVLIGVCITVVVLLARDKTKTPALGPSYSNKNDEEKRKGVDDADFVKYFCSYELLSHQKEMLADVVRMDAYHDAVMQNAKMFEGKVVLDVGCGSGILSIWAARAGAKRVYAVEATHMARHARDLVKRNGWEHVVNVIEGTIESIKLPERVDIIVSEWMGLFLLRESMLDSVLYARDKWLRSGGSMFPSHASLYLAPISLPDHEEKQREYDSELASWDEFVERTRARYGVDFEILTGPFEKERNEHTLHVSRWSDVKPSALLGEACKLVTLDIASVTVEQLKDLTCSFEMVISEDRFLSGEFDGPRSVQAFCGWFDVDFLGSPKTPTDVPIKLSTEPVEHGCTHWGQQVFSLHPEHTCVPGDVFEGRMKIRRNRDNQRLLDLEMDYAHVGRTDRSIHVRRFFIE